MAVVELTSCHDARSLFVPCLAIDKSLVVARDGSSMIG
jgi:hypothetical protein